MTRGRTRVVSGLLLLFIVNQSPPVYSAGETAAPPDKEHQPPERTQKESAPSAEQKKKREGEVKAPDSPSKAVPDDKVIKTEEPPPPPPPPAPAQPQPQPQLKQEEPAGKKPVVSINLTIKLALISDPLLFPYEIEVEMDGPKAVLTGTVSSEEEKGRAAEIAQKVEGVESVSNKLSVSAALRASWAKKQDEFLTHILKERFNKSETLKSAGFDVKAENGIIALNGKTRLQVIALEAAEAARQVPGVRAVHTAAAQIKLALIANPALFPYEIEVEMDGPKAVLTGTVSSEEEKGRAAEIAQKVEGVESVSNKLSVSPALRASWAKKQDEALTHIVKERFNKSETLKSAGFDVKAENGIITLNGKTRFQVIALEAAEAARHVPGVRAVNTAAVQITGKD